MVRTTPETLVNDLEASVRLRNCLVNEGGYLISQGKINDGPAKVKHFLGVSDAELLRTPNFGRKSLKEWHEMTAHLRSDFIWDNGDHLAELKLIKGITSQIRMIAASHKSTGTLYTKLADIIDNIK